MDYRLIRSRRKTTTISVQRDGTVVVRAPYKYPVEKIERFLEEKEAWIRMHQQRFAAARIETPAEQLDGYRLLLLGEYYEIRLCEVKAVVADETLKMIFVPSENSEQRLVAWLKEKARSVFTAALQARAKQMNAPFRSFRLSSARTRWGSCSAKNDIRLCFRLIFAPWDVIDYVVVHELAHCFVKNHSPAYWARVAAVLPSHKEKRKWLKDRPALMSIF